MLDLFPCPVCYVALIRGGQAEAMRAGGHIDWHAATDTLSHWTEDAAREELQRLLDVRANDDTVQLPPITDTVRRRPPVPGVRELQGAALLRALAAELDAGTFSDDDDTGR